jgi:hypothetical protein
MRALYFLISAAALTGCNAILGIEEAHLGDASTGAAGAGGGGACSDMAPDPCNQCIAARCCEQYEACIADNDCKTALTAYNVCVGIDFTNDAGGGTCDETLGASGNARRSAFAKCAFQNGPASSPPGCTDVCFGHVAGGNTCSDYCTCVAQACPEKSFDASCLDICGAFTQAQIDCRPYHCGLANTSKMNMNEPGRLTHCGHAFGEALCP